MCKVSAKSENLFCSQISQNLKNQVDLSTHTKVFTPNPKYKKNNLVLVNNTIVNDRHNAQFINIKEKVTNYIINNIFAGKGKIPISKDELKNNTIKKEPRFKNRRTYDYHLVSNSEAVNKGVIPGKYDVMSLLPQYEYSHAGNKKRIINDAIDHGAFEFEF